MHNTYVITQIGKKMYTANQKLSGRYIATSRNPNTVRVFKSAQGAYNTVKKLGAKVVELELELTLP